MKQYLDVMSQYATLNGRATRAEYWQFYFINTLIALAFVGLTVVSGRGLFLMLGALVSLVTILPGFAVTTRRLHDTGRSGLAMLWALVPVFGALVLLYILALPGDDDSNEYGPAR